MAEIDLDSLVDLDSLPSQQQPSNQEGVVGRVGNYLRSGAAGIAQTTGQTLDVLGLPGGETVRGLAPDLPQGFQSPSATFMNEGQPGFNWGSFGPAVVEQTPQIAQSVALRGAGALAGGALGSIAGPGGAVFGGAVGAFAAPAIGQALQVIGPVALERARSEGRDKPNQEDLLWAFGTAAGAGALESLGIGRLVGAGGRGILARIFSEFLTEGGQAFVQQAGETANTSGGLRFNPGEALGEALIGAGAGAGPAVVARVRDAATAAPSGNRNTAVEDPNDVALAQRIQTRAQDNDLDLSLRDRGTTGGAWAAVSGVRNDIRADLNVSLENLRGLARAEGDDEALRTLGRVSASIRNRDSGAAEADIQALESRFGDYEDGQRIASLARQARRLNEFLQPQGTYGGLSAYTRFMDPTEKHATGFQRAIGILSPLGLPGMAINRTARGIDRLTGNYSPVQKFVDNAAGKDAVEYSGRSATAETTTKAVTDSVWDVAAQMETARTGTPVTAEELRNKALATKALASLRSAEETIANAAMGNENRHAKTVRNGMAYTQADTALARKQTAETGAAAAQVRLTQTQSNAAAAQAINADRVAISAAKVQLAQLSNNIAQGKLNSQQAMQAISLEIAQNRLDQGVIRERILKINEEIAAGRLSAQQARAQIAETVRQAAEVKAASKAAEAATGSTTGTAATAATAAVDPKEAGKEKLYKVAAEIKQRILDSRTNKTSPHFTDLQRDHGGMFEGARRTALGHIGTEGRLGLANTQADVGSEISTDVLEALEQMDSSATSKEERRRIYETIWNRYSDIVPESEWLTSAMRTAKDLLEAGKPTPPSAEPKKTAAEVVSAATQPTINVVVNIPGLEGIMAMAGANAYVNNPAAASSKPTTVPSTTPPAEATADPVEAGRTITTPPPPATATPESKEADKAVAKVEAKKKANGRPRITAGEHVLREVQKIERSIELAPNYPQVAQAINAFYAQPDNPVAVVKGLILEGGTDHVTFFGISNAYATKMGITQAEAAPIVISAFNALKAEGTVASIKAEPFLVKGKQQKDKNNKFLMDDVVRFNEKDPNGFYSLLEIAKAKANVDGKPADISQPSAPFSAENNFRSSTGPSIDGYPGREGDFTEVNAALDIIRQSGFRISPDLMGILGPLVTNASDNKAFFDALIPKKKDMSQVQALGLLLHQLPKTTDNIIYPEAKADSRGRMYYTNGTAHPQGSDLMKALTRAVVEAPPGEQGMNHLFHSWGNLVGTDTKGSIESRREQYIEAVPALLKLARDPFPADGVYPEDVARILDVEGPFQAIQVALDTQSLIQFIKDRGKTKATDPRKMLRDPAAMQDAAANWKTSAIAQFDGNNNAAQWNGIFTGNQRLLQDTSMMPRAGDDPNPIKNRVADMYLLPTQSAIEKAEGVVKEAFGSVVAPSNIAGRAWLRGVVKNSISTYLYDSSPQGAAQTVLTKLSKNGSYQKWIPDSVFVNARQNVKKVNGGTEFTYGEFRNGADGKRLRGEDGKTTTAPKQWRVEPFETKDENKRKVTRYAIMRSRPGGGDMIKVSTADTERAALDYPILSDLASDLSGEIRTQIDADYPSIREGLTFFRHVTDLAKAQQRPIKYKTPDGMVFEYSMDETQKDGEWASMAVTSATGFKYTLPIVDTKTMTGRGLGANVTHAHDAYVARAIQKSGVRQANSIHDSFGFHPSEVDTGLSAGVNEMARLASDPSFNVFKDIAELNGFPYIMASQKQAKLLELREGFIRQGKNNTAAEKAANKALREQFLVVPEKRPVTIDPKTILNAIS